MAETSTVGGVMSGYWAMGRLKSAIPPASVTMIDSTDAKIGRLMKKLENTCNLRKRQGDTETRRQGDKETKIVTGCGRCLRSPCLLVSLSPCLRFSPCLLVPFSPTGGDGEPRCARSGRRVRP